jgi:hypothetical protein
MTKRIIRSVVFRFFVLAFLVVMSLLTSASGPADLDMSISGARMVYVLGLGAVLALFVSGAFAVLLRWVLSTTAKRETRYLDDIKDQRIAFANALRDQREAFQQALEKINTHCPMHPGGVEAIFARERELQNKQHGGRA